MFFFVVVGFVCVFFFCTSLADALRLAEWFSAGRTSKCPHGFGDHFKGELEGIHPSAREEEHPGAVQRRLAPSFLPVYTIPFPLAASPRTAPTPSHHPS